MKNTIPAWISAVVAILAFVSGIGVTKLYSFNENLFSQQIQGSGGGGGNNCGGGGGAGGSYGSPGGNGGDGGSGCNTVVYPPAAKP